MVNLIALNLARAEIKVNCFVTFSRFERGNRSGEAESEKQKRGNGLSGRFGMARGCRLSGRAVLMPGGQARWYGCPPMMVSIRYICSARTARIKMCGSVSLPNERSRSAFWRVESRCPSAAYQKAYFRAAGKHPVFNNAGEFRTGYVFAAFVKDDDFGAGSYAGLEKTRFVLLRGVVFFADV